MTSMTRSIGRSLYSWLGARAAVAQILSRVAICLIVMSFVAIAPLSGQDCTKTPSDTTILPENASPEGFASVAATDTTPFPARTGAVTFKIKRVVGPGTDAPFTGGYMIEKWDTYVKNGVLSKSACLIIGGPSLIDGGVSAGLVTLTIFVNGYPELPQPVGVFPDCGNLVGCGSHVPPGTTYGKVWISTQHLKFAHLADPGSEPIPAENEISIAATPGAFGGQLAAYRIGSLTFKAMAPTVLIGGCCNERASFWGDVNLPSDFLWEFATRKIPYST